MLKRILNILNKHKIEPSNFGGLKKEILTYDFFNTAPLHSSDWKLIYDLLEVDEKAIMLDIFQNLMNTSYYSYFLYNGRQFYSEIGQPVDAIDRRIEELKDFYSFVY